MEYGELLKKRRSIRDFLDKKVELSLIKEILHEASLAPSACNLQPGRFIIIQDQSLMKRISDDCKKGLISHVEAEPNCFLKRLENSLKNPNFNIFYNAPTLVLMVGKKEHVTIREDLALFAAYFMFASTTRNLGTCFIGLAEEINKLKLKKEIGIEKGEEVIVPIIIGYPKNIPSASPRKEVEVTLIK